MIMSLVHCVSYMMMIKSTDKSGITNVKLGRQHSIAQSLKNMGGPELTIHLDEICFDCFILIQLPYIQADTIFT